MLPRKQSFNIWFHHRPSLCRRLSATLLHSIPNHNTKALLSEDRDCDSFLPWLEKKAGIGVSSVLSIGKSADYGRALFASRFIQSGDCILRVPYSVQISPDNLIPEVDTILANDVGNLAKLAVVILAERIKGQDSEWAPYVGCLPCPGEIHSTVIRYMFFYILGGARAQDDKAKFCMSCNYQPEISNYEGISGCEASLGSVSSIFSRLYARGFYTRLCNSWITGMGKHEGFISDFLNHDATSQSIVLSDDLKQISEVVADRNYAPGEEVVIRYGKFPNSTLLMDFGFTLPYNLHDQAQIRMDIPQNDHLCGMKLEILHRHHFPAIKDATFNSTGGSFLIKELKSNKGNGKGIPQSLRAFARVMSCSSPEELNELVKEAAETDGRLARRPLINTSREIHAHQILLSKINELIDEYKASIKALRDSKLNNKLSLRQQMALDLLMGEVRVLRSASEWLKNYCIWYKEQLF